MIIINSKWLTHTLWQWEKNSYVNKITYLKIINRKFFKNIITVSENINLIIVGNLVTINRKWFTILIIQLVKLLKAGERDESMPRRFGFCFIFIEHFWVLGALALNMVCNDYDSET